MERIEASPIRKLFVTDSVENQPATLSDRLGVVSVAPLFAEAIQRIHHRQSVSVLFDGQASLNPEVRRGRTTRTFANGSRDGILCRCPKPAESAPCD